MKFAPTRHSRFGALIKSINTFTGTNNVHKTLQLDYNKQSNQSKYATKKNYGIK